MVHREWVSAALPICVDGRYQTISAARLGAQEDRALQPLLKARGAHI